jgi:hypothetical protein
MKSFPIRDAIPFKYLKELQGIEEKIAFVVCGMGTLHGDYLLTRRDHLRQYTGMCYDAVNKKWFKYIKDDIT